MKKEHKLYLASPLCFYPNGYDMWNSYRKEAEFYGFTVTMPNDNKLVEEGEKVTLGDINFDGKISARDSLIAQRGSIGLIKLSAKESFVGDVDEDGKVTTRDCLGILRYSINLNTNTATGQERIYKET